MKPIHPVHVDMIDTGNQRVTNGTGGRNNIKRMYYNPTSRHVDELFTNWTY